MTTRQKFFAFFGVINFLQLVWLRLSLVTSRYSALLTFRKGVSFEISCIPLEEPIDSLKRERYPVLFHIFSCFTPVFKLFILNFLGND